PAVNHLRTGRMTHVRFGIGFAPNVPARQVIEAAQLAERLGFDVFWITDSHLAAREAMAMLGALAVSTERIHLGPGVSHLAGRHPSVIASAMATLNELAPGPTRRLSLGYVHQADKNRVRIYIAGSGERTQRLAGRGADGALD